jgi:uncharacterized membrane protein
MTTLTNGVLVEKPRISSIDLMRGIVMVIMALDHSRDFFHTDAIVFEPTDLTKTNPVLFFTRWITHYCAPTFVFLSGVSVCISLQRKSKKELSWFLLTRGFWLVVLELTVIRFGIMFNLYYDALVFQVIWVIGASMMVLSALIYLETKTIFILGLIIVFGHNLLDMIHTKPEDGASFVLMAFLHHTGFFPLGPFLLVIYPLIPWLGIMMAGVGLGMLYKNSVASEKRKKILLISGLSAIGLFILLRAIGLYGDPAPWSVQHNAVFTFMSFVNCTKYPPSLLYTLMTLGPVLVILSLMEKVTVKSSNPFLIFGRVPLFYYILHFYFIHFGAWALYVVLHNVDLSTFDFHFNQTFGIPLEGRFPLIGAYIAWITVVALLYPICKWYNRYKSTHQQWWLSYL